MSLASCLPDGDGHLPCNSKKEGKCGEVQELKREQMEEQRRAAAAARQELKEEKKAKQTATGPAPSMALRTQASLQRALSNDDDGMFWDYGPAAGLRAGIPSTPSSFLLHPSLLSKKIHHYLPHLVHQLQLQALGYTASTQFNPITPADMVITVSSPVS